VVGPHISLAIAAAPAAHPLLGRVGAEVADVIGAAARVVGPEAIAGRTAADKTGADLTEGPGAANVIGVRARAHFADHDGVGRAILTGNLRQRQAGADLEDAVSLIGAAHLRDRPLAAVQAIGGAAVGGVIAARIIHAATVVRRAGEGVRRATVRLDG